MISYRTVALFLVLTLQASVASSSTTYFVNSLPTVGHDGFDGRAETWSGPGSSGPFLTIQHAIEMAVSGDTICVKATTQPYASFTVNKPNLTIEGYHLTPGDLGTTWGELGLATPFVEPVNVYGEIAHDATLRGDPQTEKMAPLIKNDYTATGITVSATEAHIRHFWINKCSIGIVLTSSANWCEVADLYIWDIGDNAVTYNGVGIALQGDTNDVSHCVLYNAGVESFQIHSDDNDVSHCVVIGDDNSGASPKYRSNVNYYFVIQSGHGNTLHDCDAYRLPDVYVNPGTNTFLEHKGHGFLIGSKTNQPHASYNNIEGCRTYNMDQLIHLRGTNTYENTITHCTQVKQYPFTVDLSRGSIHLADGPKDNHFDNLQLVNSTTAVSFIGLDSSQYPFTTTASGNIFRNCIFEFTYFGIGLFADPSKNIDVDDNLFENCTFVEAPGAFTTYLFDSGLDAHNNNLVNCIVADIDNWNHSTGYSTTSFNFSTCVFDGVLEGIPSSVLLSNYWGVTFEETTFYTPSSGDAIGHGSSGVSVTTDFLGNPRTTPYDIGAIETE